MKYRGICVLTNVEKRLSNNMINIDLQYETMEKCQEYYDAVTAEIGKKGFIWLKNEETRQLMVYTRGEYTEQILKFLKSLK